MGPAAVLSNAQKATHIVKENEEAKKYVSNKVKLQKHTLMKRGK